MSTGNLNGFNAEAVEPKGFDVLPAGEYEIVIVNSEKRVSGNGNQYLALELQVLNGPHQNRKLFDRLNVWHPDPQTSSIALGTLSAICRAVGILTPKDSSELHDKPLRCKVTIKNDPEYGQQNQIRGYKARNAVQPAPLAAAAPAGNGQPWPQAPAPGLQEAHDRF
jgi:hypothetical protein